MKIPIVNKEDEIIGYKDRININPTDIFRTASLWIENADGDVLLAQRKLDKKIDPGKWSEAVGGTVEDDDDYISTIKREAEEELGVNNVEFEKGPKQFYSGSYKAFTQWFKTIVDVNFEFKIQEDEVEQIAWIPKDQLEKELKDTPEKFIESMSEVLELLVL